MTDRSVADAKAHFSACLREAERGEPVTVLRHGKPVAVIVSAAAWRHRQGVAGEAPNALSSLVGRLGEDGDALYDASMEIYRSRPMPRPLPPVEDKG